MTLISPQLKKMSNKSSTRGGNALSKTSSHKRREVLFLPVLCSRLFFFFFFFCSFFSKAFKHFLYVFFCLCSSSWHNNLKVLCVLHSLRGPTPVVVVLFLVFFSSVLFLHFALFCAFYLYIRRRRREDRFQSKIRHLARSQSHTTTTTTTTTTTSSTRSLLKRQLNSPRKKEDAEGCVVCAERRPPPQKKSDVGRARKRHARDISISTNSSDAFFFVVQSG